LLVDKLDEVITSSSPFCDGNQGFCCVLSWSSCRPEGLLDLINGRRRKLRRGTLVLVPVFPSFQTKLNRDNEKKENQGIGMQSLHKKIYRRYWKLASNREREKRHWHPGKRCAQHCLFFYCKLLELNRTNT